AERVPGAARQSHRNNLDDKPKEKRESSDLQSLVSWLINDVKTTYNCYTPEAKAEIACKALASAASMLVGQGALMSAGETMMRLEAAQKVLGTLRHTSRLAWNLTWKQSRAIMKAHRIGSKRGATFGFYTKEELKEKMRILEQEGGFTPQEAKELVRQG